MLKAKTDRAFYMDDKNTMRDRKSKIVTNSATALLMKARVDFFYV